VPRPFFFRVVDLDFNSIDRAVATHVISEIQYETVGFALCLTRAATNLLDVEPGAHSRQQHGDQIDWRHVEAVRENHNADECGQSSGGKVFNAAITLLAQRLAQHHLAIDAASAKVVTYHLGVFDSDAVHQPCPTRALVASDLVAGAYDDIALHGRSFELVDNEFAATLADSSNIDG